MQRTYISFSGKLFYSLLILTLVIIAGTFPDDSGYDAPMPPLQESDADFPPPGSRFKREEIHLGQQAESPYFTWRVTSPTAPTQTYLPNAIHNIGIYDLNNVERVQVMIDRWGGHDKTSEKKIRINENDWILVPEPAGTGLRPELYMFQGNPSVDIPLEQLRVGVNYLQASCSHLDPWGWGQWGAYSYMFRFYFDEEGPEYPKGIISLPKTGSRINENPMIVVKPDGGDRTITEVSVFAHVYDYDYDGDGYYNEWQGAWHQHNRLGTFAEWENHIGTKTEGPYGFKWDTSWLPDQPEDSIELCALITDNWNYVYAASVDNISLVNRPYSVKLYPTTEMPPKFAPRVGEVKTAVIEVPDAAQLDKAVEARLHLRTWNGTNSEHGDFTFNGKTIKGKALKNFYAYTFHEIPIDAIQHGRNEVTFASDTWHHGLEVLWPGPALVIKYEK